MSSFLVSLYDLQVNIEDPVASATAIEENMLMGYFGRTYRGDSQAKARLS